MSDAAGTDGAGTDGAGGEAGEAPVLAARRGGVLELTLNRPARLNAFDDDMHRALYAALESARDDAGVRAVLLTGAGRGFCAGQDLGARDPAKLGGPPDLEHTLTTFYNPLVRLIRGLELPVVCAVNGVAAGAGANVALACDVVLAADTASFLQPFARIGLLPDAGGSWSLAALVGEARAKGLAMTATPLDAPTAADWGLIWKAVPADALVDEARALCESFASGATFGIALTKRAIQAAATNTLDEQLELEATLQGRAGRSADYAEGVAAFLAKRAPSFTGEPSE